MDPTPRASAVDLLPELTGREALALSRVLTQLSDAIWALYGIEIALVLEREYDSHRPDSATTIPPLTDDEDLPF